MMRVNFLVAASLLAFSQSAFNANANANANAAATSAAPAAEQPDPSQGALKPATPAIAAKYGNLPLSFEANDGQSDARVKFLSRGSGYSLFLTDSAAVLALTKRDPASGEDLNQLTTAGKRPARTAKPAKTDVVRMELAGASHGLRVTGAEQLPGTANHIIGNDPAKWHTKVPTYAKVKYSGVYPGIDLVYYGNQRQLEYDFVVAPGADPKEVRLRFAGAKKLKLNADGDLTVVANNGEIAFHKPAVYQQSQSGRESVEGRFVMMAGNSVGFAVGQYDRSRQLVIDPVLTYSTYLGGSGGDSATAIAVDSGGNAYVTGYTSSMDFPVFSKTEVYQNANKASASGLSNAFVAKFNPNLSGASSLIYSTYLGGSGNTSAKDSQDGSVAGDSGKGIAVDGSGDAYVTGEACSSDFPTTKNAFQTVNNAYLAQDYYAGCNAFVTELDPTGATLVYSSYLGGGGGNYVDKDCSCGYVLGDSGTAIAVDASGNAYIAGYTESSDFPVTPGVYQSGNHAAVNYGSNAFIAEFNPHATTGESSLLYSTCLGGNGVSSQAPSAGDAAYGIAIDAGGDVYVAGTAYSTDFPVENAYQSTNQAGGNGSSNAFVAKLNPALNGQEQLLYSTYLGGSGQPIEVCCYYNGYYADSSAAVAVDSAGDAYVTGLAYSSDFPVTMGAFQSAYKGASNHSSNAFVAKFNLESSGVASLVYSTYLGGSGAVPSSYGNGYGDAGQGIAADAAGDAFVTGYASSQNFPVTAAVYQSGNSAFLTELNPKGSGLLYSTYLGGSAQDYGNGLAMDGAGNAYIAGQAYSSNFPLTKDPYQASNNSHPINSSNAFVAKFAFGRVTQPLQFIPVTPCRIADTRNPTGPFGGPEPTAGSSREFEIPQSACNIPSIAVAYSLNVTVVPNAALGYLTLWPTGQALPLVSTLNSDGRVKANAAIVPAGTSGGVSVYVTNPTQVILDIDGYFVPAGTADGLAFYPVTPCRIADTRNANGPLGGPSLAAGGIRAFPVQSSTCNIPSTAQAYSLNVTAVPHTTLGYLTIWPTGESRPTASTLNAPTGVVTANAAIVPAGSGGDVSVFVENAADVVLDVNGYFAPPSTGGLSFYPAMPCRVIDTRQTTGNFRGVLPVAVENSVCVPPASAQAYVFNATVVPDGALGYLTLWPAGASQPAVSTLNAADKAITSNMAIVPTTNGDVDAFADGATNLILDLSGYFAP